MSQKYYKSLRSNMASWYDKDFVWKSGHVMEVLGADDSPRPCSKGLHLAKSVDYALEFGYLPARVFEVVPLSHVLGENDYKIRVAKAKIVREVDVPHLMVASISTEWFRERLKTVKWFNNHGKIEDNWRVFETKLDAEEAYCKVPNPLLSRLKPEIRKAAAKKGLEWVLTSGGGDNSWFPDCEPLTATGRKQGEPDGSEYVVLNGPLFDWSWMNIWLILVYLGVTFEADISLHVPKRWFVWEDGYGLLGEFNGDLYVYKKLS